MGQKVECTQKKLVNFEDISYKYILQHEAIYLIHLRGARNYTWKAIEQFTEENNDKCTSNLKNIKNMKNKVYRSISLWKYL